MATVANGLVTARDTGETSIIASAPNGAFARTSVKVRRTAEGLEVEAGDAQLSTVGLPLEEELQVRVLSGAGNPVPGASVEFSVVKGGGEVSSRLVDADGDGVARAYWTLGPIAGDQRVEAHPVDRPGAVVAFVATARPGDPEALHVRPQGVSLKRGAQFQFEATVRDRFGNMISSVPVTWSSEDERVATINSDGRLTARGDGETNVVATLAAGAFVFPEGIAASNGGGRAFGRVSVEDLDGGDESLRILSGDGQVGVVGEELEETVEVQAVDGLGRPIRQQDVEWIITAGGGQVSGASARTDGQGRASARWTLGTTVETNRLEARIKDVGSVSFLAGAVAGPLAVIEVTPSTATILVDEEQDFELRTTDAYGNPVQPSSTPEWSTGNTAVAVISAPGRARGETGGVTEVRANISGVEGTAELTVDRGEAPDEPSVQIVSGDGQSAVVGEELGEELAIQALDGWGDPIPLQDVEWIIAAGGGQLSDASSGTDDQGRATARWTLGTSAETNQVEVRVPDVGTVSFLATAVAGPLAIVEVTPDTATISVGEEQAFELKTTDAYGNPVESSSTPEWSTGNTAVAVISAPGKAKGEGGGATEVRATVSGMEGTTTLTVEGDAAPDPEGGDGDGGTDDGDASEPQAASVVISPSSLFLEAGATAEVQATVLDLDGNEMTGVTPEWSSSDPSIATVEGTGQTALVTAVSSGSATIRATVDDVLGTQPVEVTEPAPPPSSGGVIPAFPGAEGWGATALNECRALPIQTLFVTNTNTDGPGSLDQAVADARSDRFTFIVFRTGGVIVAPGDRNMRLNASCVYFAGQTAPGDGIAIQGQGTAGLWFRGSGDNISDIVMRHIRFRGRSGATKSNLIIAKGERIVLDHMSFSWTDRYALALNRYDHSTSQRISNVSIQNSIISEAFAVHPTAFILNSDAALKDVDVLDMSNVSIHRNLMAHNSHRNPMTAADNAAIVNNVIYNWRIGAGMMNRRGTVDWVNNYAKAGPMTQSAYTFAVNPYCDSLGGDFSIYAAGNLSPQSGDPNGDNWKDPTRQITCYRSTGGEIGAEVPSSWRRNAVQNWGSLPYPVSVGSAEAAYLAVAQNAGANRRLTCDGLWVDASDPVDRRVLGEVRNGTGVSSPPENEADVGGYPVYATGTACSDSDGDGLPDGWEQLHFGSPTGANASAMGRNGYLVIEHYLNGTTP